MERVVQQVALLEEPQVVRPGEPLDRRRRALALLSLLIFLLVFLPVPLSIIGILG